jgi:hypothetical protein
LRLNAHQHFVTTWQAWTPALRHAFTAIALLTTKAQVLAQLPLDLPSFRERLPELLPELSALETAGVLRQTQESAPVAGATEAIGWQIGQGVLLTWLWDELIRETRTEDRFGQWLRTAELDGRWSDAQRRQVQALVNTFVQQHPQAAINIVLTEGGSYIAGAVEVAGDFVNRDQRK